MKNYKLPKTIKDYQNLYKLNYNTLLSENPKTIKSDIKTYILHLAPSKQSGIINVCPSALNCAKLCLHHCIIQLRLKVELIKQLHLIIHKMIS